MREIRKCSYCEKEGNSNEIRIIKETNTFVCSKHRSQILRYGKIIEETIYSEQLIIVYDDYAEIVIYSKPNIGEERAEKCRVIIDLDDVEKCKNHKWHVRDGYAFSKTAGNLHYFVLDRVVDLENITIDHADTNIKNCRKNNLRLATRSQQLQNQNKKSGYNNKYKGVTRHCEKYATRITFNKKAIHLGRFNTEEEAALAYNQKAIELFGEFAKLNIINKEVI